MLILRRPWAEQPQSSVGIDWSNPDTRGLILCVLSSNPTVNLAGSGTLTVSGSTAVTPGRHGQYVVNDASNSYDYTPPATLTAGTIFSFERRAGAGTEQGPWRTNNSENDYTPYSDGNFYLNTWGSSRWLSAVPVTLNDSGYAVAVRGSSGAQAAFVDGVQIGSASQTFTVNATIALGRNNVNPTPRSHSYIRMLWDRSLSDVEIKRISANPWSIFEPRRTYIPLSTAAPASSTTGTLVLRKPWTEQPSYNAPLALPLRALSSIGWDAPEQATATLGGSITRGAGPGGRALVVPSSGTGDYYTGPSVSTQSYCGFAVIEITTGGLTSSILDRDYASTRQFQLRLETNGTLTIIGFNTSNVPYLATTSAAVPYVSVQPVAFRANGASIQVWHKGGTATATITGTPSSWDGTYGVGASWGGTTSLTNQLMAGRIYASAMVVGYLPDAIFEQFVSDPWQLFEPRRTYIPLSTGAAAALPTLSAATYVPGSITATGFRPRVTATY